jgi:hypothetical protein
MSDGNTDNTGDGTPFSPLEFALERHDIITQAAHRLLDVTAKARVEELLAAGSTQVEFWGGWADRIKGGGAPSDAETVAFLQDPANRSHPTWHFVNLPLESEGYGQAADNGFTRDDDVVQTIRKCIVVLKGGSGRFSEVNALRLVGHFAGDVHQPLHVACGFMDDSTDPPTLLFDPQEVIARNLVNHSDRGGNNVKLPSSGNMHSFWDGSLGGNAGNIVLENVEATTTKEDLIREIFEQARAMGSETEGAGLSEVVAIEDRVVEWADGSLAVALEAYKNIRIVAKVGQNYTGEFKTTKNDYVDKFRPVILNQMALAARRLADLLNDLFPDPVD